MGEHMLLTLFMIMARGERSHDDLVALAAALTGLMAVPGAILVFFLDRALRQRASLQDVSLATAAAVLVTAAYTAIVDADAWWAWVHASDPDTRFIIGLGRRAFFAVLFAPPVGLAGIATIWILTRLLTRLYRAIIRSPA
jgi:hypothetical protein